MGQHDTPAPKRPECFDFAMDFLGGTEAAALGEYIERLEATLSATQPAQAKQSDWSAQRFNAPVYPPDGTESPFTVINLGSGKVQMGDSIHDGRLPALWFGINGQGMGHEETMNREAHPGETLAVVTFANVEGLDVLLDVIQRIRRENFPEAQAAQGWKLVPVEPTKEMRNVQTWDFNRFYPPAEIWAAMLAASPTPPAHPAAAQGAGEVLAESYVQTVPDKCDRIVWRGYYYTLPPTPPAQAAADANGSA